MFLRVFLFPFFFASRGNSRRFVFFSENVFFLSRQHERRRRHRAAGCVLQRRVDGDGAGGERRRPNARRRRRDVFSLQKIRFANPGPAFVFLNAASVSTNARYPNGDALRRSVADREPPGFFTFVSFSFRRLSRGPKSARRTPRDGTRRARRNARRRAASSRASPGLSRGRRGEGPSPNDTRARNASRATRASPTDASALTSVCPRARTGFASEQHFGSLEAFFKACFRFPRRAAFEGAAFAARSRSRFASRTRAPAGVARVCTSALPVAIRSRIGTGSF